MLGAAVYRAATCSTCASSSSITGALIILFAAGLVDRAVLFLQASGDVGTWDNAVYDLTRYRWLTQQTQVGRFLAGIFGWDPRPSIEQVVAYLAYLVPVLTLFFRQPRPRAALARRAGRRRSTPSRHGGRLRTLVPERHEM